MAKFAFHDDDYGDYDLDSPDNMLSNYSFHVTNKKTGKTTHHLTERDMWEKNPRLHRGDVGASLEMDGMSKWLEAGSPKSLHKVDQSLDYEDEHHKIKAVEAKGSHPKSRN